MSSALKGFPEKRAVLAAAAIKPVIAGRSAATPGATLRSGPTKTTRVAPFGAANGAKSTLTDSLINSSKTGASAAPGRDPSAPLRRDKSRGFDHKRRARRENAARPIEARGR